MYIISWQASSAARGRTKTGLSDINSSLVLELDVAATRDKTIADLVLGSVASTWASNVFPGTTLSPEEIPKPRLGYVI